MLYIMLQSEAGGCLPNRLVYRELFIVWGAKISLTTIDISFFSQPDPTQM